MRKIEIKNYNKKRKILALGAESAGNFSVFSDGKIFHSKNFDDLLNEKNFENYQKRLLSFIGKKKIKPEIVLTDLHPLYKTTELGNILAKKFKAKIVQIEHHHSHIFSGAESFLTINGNLPKTFYGIACDGTGLGTDDNIWGGEVFKISNGKIERIGHLENQTLIGADLAVKEPARVLISVLSKFLDKQEVFLEIKKHYSKNEFELLFNQMNQNFNCQESSSTGRILDAAAVFLDIAKNERVWKHQATELLAKNSGLGYKLEPKIEKVDGKQILLTTPLFEYLLKNKNRDKKRLAATVQEYIANGLLQIVKKDMKKFRNKKSPIIFGGGLSENKIMKKTWQTELEKNKVPNNLLVELTPKGDAGLSLGQVFCYFFSSSL